MQIKKKIIVRLQSKKRKKNAYKIDRYDNYLIMARSV